MRWLVTFIALNLALCALILLTLWTATDLFSGHDALGLHGWIAMGLGIAATSALGVGLMGLVFYSHRARKDDDIG